MQFRPLCTPDLAVKGTAAEGEAHPIRCKRWSCPVCAEINRARVIQIAKAAKPRALLTLTVSSKDYPEPNDAAQALKKGLRLLRLRLARHPKLENFQFLAVFERHKSGHPHLHLLIKGSFIPWKWLRSVWEDVTGSYMVDIRKIATTGQAAMYCAKYIGKDLSAFAHCKRWWRSHGYSEGVSDDYEPDWRLGMPTRHLAEVHRVRAVLAYEGFDIERIGRDGIRWRAPPGSAWTLEALLCAAMGQARTTAKGRKF